MRWCYIYKKENIHILTGQVLCNHIDTWVEMAQENHSGLQANVQRYRPTEDSAVTQAGLDDQGNSDHLLVCSHEASINFPLQGRSQGTLDMPSDSILILKFTVGGKKCKPFKWCVTSSGFSLVIRAAITWSLGQGTWAEFSKSMGASPQGETPYIIRISLILYRGIPMAIWKVIKHTSLIFHSYFP